MSGPPAATVLVAYATKFGSNREIAEAIGETLRSEGLTVEVRPAGEIRDVRPYRAVVLGSAIYSATWLKEANRFARIHAEALAERPVWLFSSGPLDHSADHQDIPITAHAAEVVAGFPYRGHRTFGGRLLADTPGLDPAILATHRTGDFRDFAAVRDWAREIAAELRDG